MKTRNFGLFILIVFIGQLLSCKDHQSNENNIEEIDGQEFFVVEEPIIHKRGEAPLEPVEVTWELSDNGPLKVHMNYVQEYFDSIKTTDFILKESRDCSMKVEAGPGSIIIGDINLDGHHDALIPFRFIKPNQNPQDKRIKNLFQNFYLVTINDGSTLIPIEIFYAGNEEAELLSQFRSINEKGEILGKQVPNVFNKYPDEFDIKYHLSEGFLMAL